MLAVVNTPQANEAVAFREVEEPHPAPGEALIEVEAFSLNRGELGLLERRPDGWRPGQDLAGTVARQAADGSGPPVGTRVLGLTEGGGWAERAAVRTDRMAPLAGAVPLEHAAVLPIPGLTALRALRRGGLLLDKRVMVTGATGIVGSLAVELASAAGARVTAVARRDAAADLRARGVSAVIEQPEEADSRFSIILESVGGATLRGAMLRVAAGGVIVVYGNTSRQPAAFSFMDFATAQNARIETLYHFTSEPESCFAPDLALLAHSLETGRIKPKISGQHGWRELPAIVATLRAERFRGKHVFWVKQR